MAHLTHPVNFEPHPGEVERAQAAVLTHCVSEALQRWYAHEATVTAAAGAAAVATTTTTATTITTKITATSANRPAQAARVDQVIHAVPGVVCGLGWFGESWPGRADGD